VDAKYAMKDIKHEQQRVSLTQLVEHPTSIGTV